MKTKSISILLLLSAIILCSGCGTIIGKRVELEREDISRLSEYSKYYLVIDKESETSYLDVSIEALMVNNGIKQIYTSGEVKRIKEDYLRVDLYINKSFCLPPIFGHMNLIFFMPTNAVISLSDGRSKKKLLKVEYNRALLATNAGPYECKDMIIGELEKVFVESKKGNP